MFLPTAAERKREKKENKKRKRIACAIREKNNSVVGVDSCTRSHTRGRKGRRVRCAAVDYEWSSLDLSFSLIVSYALYRTYCRPELYNNLMPDIISYLLSGRLPGLPYSFLYESWKAAATSRRASPRRAARHHATPCHATPRHAAPRHAALFTVEQMER